jgi:hypothetical protein
MADAPAGGSGGGLAGVEIIVLVVLAIGAISVLSGNPIKPVNNTAPSSTTSNTTAPQCGIKLSRPIKNERITNLVTVVGTVTSCDQTPLLATVLTAQVVDKSGAPMSDLTHITMAAATDSSASFSGALPITGNPLPGTGYLIITGPTRPDGTSLSVRTPIRF